MEAKTYTCPECGGTDKKWTYRNGRREPYLCWLCQGDKTVTLDQIMDNANDPIEYFQRIIAEKEYKPEPDPSDYGDIPF